MDVGWDANEHEQFVARIELDLHPAFDVDLDVPTPGELIADLDVDVKAAGQAPTTLDGELEDDNDGVAWPSGGVYRWKLRVTTTTGPIECPALADTNAGDGHLHFEATLCAALVNQARQTDTSVTKVTEHIEAQMANGPFLTNPAVGGSYTSTVRFVGYDEPNNGLDPGDETRSTSLSIANRVPSSVDLAPASTIRKVNQNHTATATVLDQRNEALEGASVVFEVTAGAHSGFKCSEVLTGANGMASCTYAESTPSGDDTLRATATRFDVSKTDTAVVNWDRATTLDLTPETVTKRVGQSHTLTALVTDDEGTPMSGETVDFSVAGANPGGGSAPTGADGRASFTYTGGSAGDDSISASVAGTPASDGADASWYSPVPAELSLTPEQAQRSIGQAHTVTASVEDQAGAALEGEMVTFTVTAGPNQGDTGQDVTDAQGNASFAYTGEEAGTDTIEAVAGDAADTAGVEWIGDIPTTLQIEYIPVEENQGAVPSHSLWLESEEARWRYTIRRPAGRADERDRRAPRRRLGSEHRHVPQRRHRRQRPGGAGLHRRKEQRRGNGSHHPERTRHRPVERRQRDLEVGPLRRRRARRGQRAPRHRDRLRGGPLPDRSERLRQPARGERLRGVTPAR